MDTSMNGCNLSVFSHCKIVISWSRGWEYNCMKYQVYEYIMCVGSKWYYSYEGRLEWLIFHSKIMNPFMDNLSTMHVKYTVILIRSKSGGMIIIIWLIIFSFKTIHITFIIQKSICMEHSQLSILNIELSNSNRELYNSIKDLPNTTYPIRELSNLIIEHCN